MRLRLPHAALAALSFAAVPAHAQDSAGADYAAQGYDEADAGYPEAEYMPPQPGTYHPADAREAWLADCRQRLAARDRGVGGALIGGAAGGLPGNRIAGRGNRTVGTIAGAAVGAAAGAVIDKAEDSGRDRDECEAYLDDYYARAAGGYYPGQGYPQQGYYSVPTGGAGYAPYAGGYAPYGYGYGAPGCCMAQPMMMVPVRRAEPECTETIEYVYEDVPVRPARRAAPRRKAAVDKRVRIAPGKRVPVR